MASKLKSDALNQIRRKAKQICFAGGLIVLLAACGGQQVSDTGNAVKNSSQTGNLANATESKLLTSLSASYPSGQLPAAFKVDADIALAQNPAVLKMSASSVNIANVKTGFNNRITAQAATADAGSYSPVYRIQNTSLPGSYFFTIYDSERLAAVQLNPGWKLEGAAFYTATGTTDGVSPVYRFRNKTNGSYVYTIYQSEYQSLLDNYSATFVLEGVSWYARQTPGSGYVPLYRFRNKTNGTYLFSAYEGEKDAIVRDYSAIFELEGISYYVNISDTNPDCVEKLPEKTLATLPTSYSVKLLDDNLGSNGNPPTGAIFLTNTGYVSWETVCASYICEIGERIIKAYSSSTDTIRQSPVLGAYVKLISLNDTGVSLIGVNSSDSSYDQAMEINNLPFAKLWDGVTVKDSVVRGVKRLNHKTGRHTFLAPMGGVNDGSNRKWAYPTFPSYLDGAKVVNTGSTLTLGEPPVAANKCGTSISNPFSSNTSSGLYFARGTLPINTYGAPFTIDSNVFPSFQAVGLTTTTSYGAFTRNEFIPYRTPQFVGFIKSAAWERHYPDISVIDVNDANTGVGNDKREFNTRLGSGIVDGSGAILTSDGFQDLRSLVPSLQIDGRLVQALAINNHGQIAVKTCLVSFYGGCSDYKLHLLTPQ